MCGPKKRRQVHHSCGGEMLIIESFIKILLITLPIVWLCGLLTPQLDKWDPHLVFNIYDYNTNFINICVYSTTAKIHGWEH